MSARQLACGKSMPYSKPASFLNKANEFFAFQATSRATPHSGAKLSKQKGRTSLLCPAVQPLAWALRLHSCRAVSSQQAKLFYHLKKGADTFGNIFF